MTAFFFSDAHLGHDSPGRERLKLEKLSGFFDMVAAEGGQLYILGDLFDFWFEYKHAIPKDYIAVLCRLSKLVESGIEVSYLAGNHDFWLGSLLTDDLGVQVHRDELSLTRDGKKLLLTHGDGLARSDRAYRVLKKVMRNRFGIFLYRQVPPDIGIPLAKWCSQLSRGRTAGLSKETFLQEYRDYAERKLLDGYDFVVCAHTHYPEKIEFESGVYINTGDWFESFTYAVLRDGAIELRKWNRLKGGSRS